MCSVVFLRLIDLMVFVKYPALEELGADWEMFLRMFPNWKRNLTSHHLLKVLNKIVWLNLIMVGFLAGYFLHPVMGLCNALFSIALFFLLSHLDLRFNQVVNVYDDLSANLSYKQWKTQHSQERTKTWEFTPAG